MQEQRKVASMLQFKDVGRKQEKTMMEMKLKQLDQEQQQLPQPKK